MQEHPNFLTQPGVPEIPAPGQTTPDKPRRNLRMFWPVFLLVVIGGSLLLAPAVYGGWRAGTAAVRAQADLKDAEAHALAREFTQADTSLAAAESDLADVRAGLTATGFWQYAPYIGSKIGALQDVERVGSQTVSGLRDLIAAAIAIEDALAGPTGPDGLPVAPTRSYSDLSKDEKRAILASLEANLPKLRAAREKVAIASEAWKHVPQDQLFAPLRDRLAPLADRLPDASRQLDEAVSMLEIAIPILGYPTPKTYLVLLQNADELRPGGGFIGNVGLMHVDGGDLDHIDFEDVYAVDDPVAATWKDVPPPLVASQLGVKAWFLRDSNWSPDFPTDAQRIADVYVREKKQGINQDVQVDGVIALEPELFRRLLLLTGPLNVSGKSFTADNFFDELQYDVEEGFLQQGIPVKQRKDIVAAVGDTLIKTLTSQPASRWPSMLDIAAESLTEKDIMLYSQDASLQSLIDGRGWGGRALSAEGDELWVVDANLAALKTDGVMDKQIFYSIDPSDPAGLVATVRLHYTNTNTKIDWRYTRYRSYTRVYVPEGSQLMSWSGAGANPDTFHELGKQVFGAFWVIEPGKTGDLTFTYRLPPQIADQVRQGSYTLLAQKQAGANTKLTLDLRLGKTVRSASPSEDPNNFGDDRYQYETDLTKNETFTLSF
ncbi:MAG TPA: DUF4012 domain-containing protein [Verrucomicrobiae bacterium]|nr:DUF4012 domain-containing protein [Verrucomicrobiae bacterium]